MELSHNIEEYRIFVSEGLEKFREWYQPIDFGYGIIAHVRLPPDYLPQEEKFNNNTQGLSRWDYIVKPNIPDLHEKRVLDIGCSSGLFSIQMALDGAKEVIGIDRPSVIRWRTNKYARFLKRHTTQDIIEQAYFVKSAFERRYDKELNVRFIGHDINEIENLNLGKFDIVIALCTVYHELSRMPKLLKAIAKMSDLIVLQANLEHNGRLKVWSNELTHVDIMLTLGFDVELIRGGEGYPKPLIICRRSHDQNHKKSEYSELNIRYTYIKYKYVILSVVADVRWKLSRVKGIVEDSGSLRRLPRRIIEEIIKKRRHSKPKKNAKFNNSTQEF